MPIFSLKWIYLFLFFLFWCPVSQFYPAYGMGKNGKELSGDNKEGNEAPPKVVPKKFSSRKKSEKKDTEIRITINPMPWTLLQPDLDRLIAETIADPSYEERTFCFQVRREDWKAHIKWQGDLMRDCRYPIGISSYNAKCDGDKIEGMYEVYHKEVTVRNSTQKEERARRDIAYRFFGGQLDRSLINPDTFYNLIVRAGFKPEDFKTGLHGYQDRIFVKAVQLKSPSLQESITEAEGIVSKTLHTAFQPYVAFIFELPETATFKVYDLLPIGAQRLAVIIDEKERRLYFCRENHKRGAIDLHSMSLEEAFAEVRRFLLERYADFAENCRVITGRGNHENKNGTRGVLFSQFPQWMKAPEMKQLVKAHTPLADGGYTVKFKPTMICDLMHVPADQEPYLIVRDFLRKILKANEGRLLVRVADESVHMRLIHFLAFSEVDLFAQVSPMLIHIRPGELQINLRSPADHKGRTANYAHMFFSNGSVLVTREGI